MKKIFGAATIVLFLFGATIAHASSSTVSIESLSPGTTIGVGTNVTFAVATTGFINPSYSLTDTFIDGSLGNLNLSSAGAFSWTPEANDVGSHTIVINVADNSGDQASTSLTFDVIAASAVAPAATVVTTPAVTTPVTTVVTTPIVTTPITPTFTSTLTIASTGSEVTALQQLLTAQKDFSGNITGYFGAETKAAVIKFQAANGIQQLGIVGPSTRTALNNLETSSVVSTTAPTTSVTTTDTSSDPTIAEIRSEILSIASQLTQVETQLSQVVGQ